MQLLEEHNIKFSFKISAKSFVGESGHVTGVVLADGSTVKADLCVLGLGKHFVLQSLELNV